MGLAHGQPANLHAWSPSDKGRKVAADSDSADLANYPDVTESAVAALALSNSARRLASSSGVSFAGLE